ncbi:Cof-type HAD-IIB family hydrolase [Oceanobacillus chungangensis]|uniref:Cof-type HAD-IIB family hydrolase n=1 Tax=Oceanobacillus chungangensis TaxID=1229152 RepID=A0A3D8PHJ4_9BACI|nr:Cof-type HAD-IIB family hydrolase [Oceanobacillus chungangensis]RDW15540.1 Cof-type HAD-IIB family hydrolase [Oceanobacillus chungangensis]
MVKLIALDLDGTTLNEESKISRKNIEAIKFAQKNGVEVVIATGRAYFDVKDIFKKTGIKTWIIGANGATIHRPNGELYSDIPLAKQDAFEIMSWLEEENYYYEVFSNHVIYTPQNGRELLAIEIDRAKSTNSDAQIDQLKISAQIQFSQSGFSFIDSYKDLLEKDADYYNILAFTFDEEKLQMGKEKFKNRKDLTLVSSAKHNFELEHKHASKGNALKILANKLGINIADTAAVGDSYNDLSMLRIAGKSAAMGNADQEIKDSCHEVTLSNRDDGVAHFIYSLLNESVNVH